MMKKLLQRALILSIFLGSCIITNAQNFVITFQNVPTKVLPNGDLAAGDELMFTVANIPNDNVDRNGNFRFWSAAEQRHCQIVFDISFDNSDSSTDVTIDGADVDNGDGTFTRKFIASKLSPRAGTANPAGPNFDEYLVGDVFNARVRITVPNEDTDATAGLNPPTGNVTTAVVATLSSKDFNKTKLAAYYNASKEAIVVDNAVSGKYEIYNLLGQSVKNGEFSREISVSSLKSGLYILTSEAGTLKFAK